MKRLARSAGVCALCLHVCMYLLMCRYTSACMCACKFTHVYVCLCMHVPVQVCICISVHACICVNFCVFVCARARRVLRSVMRAFPSREGLPGASSYPSSVPCHSQGPRTLRRAQLNSSGRVLAPHRGGAGKDQAPKWFLGSHIPAPSLDNRPGATSGGGRGEASGEPALDRRPVPLTSPPGGSTWALLRVAPGRRRRRGSCI